MPSVNISEIVQNIRAAETPLAKVLYSALLVFQLIRMGTWGAIGAFATAAAAMVGVICEASSLEAFVRLGRYILCSFFEAWERLKPSGRPLPPFCN